MLHDMGPAPSLSPISGDSRESVDTSGYHGRVALLEQHLEQRLGVANGLSLHLAIVLQLQQASSSRLQPPRVNPARGGKMMPWAL